jgi:hypothetical protein
VPNALLVWKSKQATGDYQYQKNKHNYYKWVQEKLIPNIIPKSVAVLDNAFTTIFCQEYRSSIYTQKYKRQNDWQKDLPYLRVYKPHPDF